MPLADSYIFELDENVTRTSVSYKNRFGITIAADLYLPKDLDESVEHPAIIVGAPYGGVKEQGPGIYAQNMALRGFVALTFDPSFNGYSGGEPRHLSSPDIFVEDFSAAVDYLGTRPFVDRERIGVIGMCGSGALSLSAAQVDPRIKAVAPVVMYDHHRLYADALTTGNPLPTPASIELPVPGMQNGDLTAATTAINSYFEAFEGMLVKYADTLSVSEYFELARYGQLLLLSEADGRAHAHGRQRAGRRPG